MNALRAADQILRDHRIITRSTRLGRYYTVCPRCSQTRKRVNQKLRCLGVTIDHRGVKFGCNHCDWTGGEFYQGGDPALILKARTRADEQRHIDEFDSRDRARRLWAKRQPIQGSIAETYLRKRRGYDGPIPATLGFLPALGEFAPAMIAAFGNAVEIEPGALLIEDQAVTGLHLTRLRADGLSKANCEASKITVGRGNTSPIVLAPPNDLQSLAIAEGIEDALSIHAATGIGAWAAGTANRLPAMAHHVPDYIDCVTIAVDDDDVGEKYATELAEGLTTRGIEVLMAHLGKMP